MSRRERLLARAGQNTPRDDPNVMPTWWSPPGTVKRFCVECEHWFSSRGTKLCLECERLIRKGLSS
jgi:hypothetical protein